MLRCICSGQKNDKAISWGSFFCSFLFKIIKKEALCDE